jgi:hypothetical protein
MADMICHKVYELLMSILYIYLDLTKGTKDPDIYPYTYHGVTFVYINLRLKLNNWTL